MMKQPAENPNATPVDERRSAQRADRARDPVSEQNEIENEARRIAETRGDQTCSPEDWNRAAEIVRNRKIALSKA